jgi:hypothetical protein
VDEPFEIDDRTRRVIAVSTVVILAAGVAASYAIDRSLQRWWHENNPWSDVRRSVERARTGYRAKRDTTTEVAEVVGAIVGGVIGALIGGDDE